MNKFKFIDSTSQMISKSCVNIGLRYFRKPTIKE